MSSPAQVLKSIGPKLVPFFKTLAIYFVLFIPADSPSVWAMFIKCLPILSLMLFVILHGMSFNDEYTFSRQILIGLIFSCFGDAFMVWPQYFIHAMGFFAIAQIFYIKAFGFQNLNIKTGISIYALSFFVVAKLLRGTTGVITFGLPIYAILLTTMLWRAASRIQFSENSWAWTEICSCVGGVFFVISDACIGFDKFSAPLPYSQFFIMSTYYLAQFGIALSVVDSSATYKLAQQKLLEQSRDSKDKRSGISRADGSSNNKKTNLNSAKDNTTYLRGKSGLKLTSQLKDAVSKAKPK